jgi:hypothetical protein
MDGRVGRVHRRAGNRGLSGRRRYGGRAGWPATDGALGGGGAASRAPCRPGTRERVLVRVSTVRGRRDNPGRVEQPGGNFDVIIDGVGGAHPRARRRARGPAWRRGEHRDPAWRRNGQLPCEVLRPGARRGDLHAESSRRARVTRQRGQRPHSAVTTRRSGVASASSSRAPHLLQNSVSSDTPAPQARQLNGCSCVKATDQPPRRQRRPCRSETTENIVDGS